RAGIRDVVTDGDTSGLVHRRASHPTKIIGRRECSLLEKHGRRGPERLPGSISQLIPANSDAAAARHRMVNHQRLVIGELSITQAIHQAISEGIELRCGAWLWNTGAAAARSAKCGNS